MFFANSSSMTEKTLKNSLHGVSAFLRSLDLCRSAPELDWCVPDTTHCPQFTKAAHWGGFCGISADVFHSFIHFEFAEIIAGNANFLKKGVLRFGFVKWQLYLKAWNMRCADVDNRPFYRTRCKSALWFQFSASRGRGVRCFASVVKSEFDIYTEFAHRYIVERLRVWVEIHDKNTAIFRDFAHHFADAVLKLRDVLKPAARVSRSVSHNIYRESPRIQLL
jgi:hypothetical protein